MAQRPTFFLSSTIYDFRDLRSAIKFSLEARGCRVLASEFNDFGGNLDQHSYEACLTNIGQADYFVLLIGSRVGGWYNEPARVSINILQLCEALILHLSGQPFRSPDLMPFSPITGFEESIRAERVSVGELRAALGIS